MKKNRNTLDTMIMIARKANQIIRDGCKDMVVEHKDHIDPNKTDDVVTNVDIRAQRTYVVLIKEYFPGYGIIGEEEGLTVPCTHPIDDLYFTLDPLDGTKAYARNQSHGVGTMLALVKNGRTIAVVIGDINTDEIYAYYGEEEFGPVYRHRFGVVAPLIPETKKPLDKQYILLRKAPRTNPRLIRDMILPPDEKGLFKDIEVAGGSIGIGLARLWKGEVGAAIIDPHYGTPWDSTPVIGISKRLGFAFFKLEKGRNTLEEYTPSNIKKTTQKTHHELIIHRTHIPELQNWLRLRKNDRRR